MTLNVSLRKLIKSHLESDKNGAQIYQALNKTVKKRTIYNWIDKINERKSTDSKTSRGRPRTVRTKQFIRKIKKNLLKDKKKKSARQLAIENNCHRKTVALVIHNDLALKTYKRITCQALTDQQKLKRKQFAGWVRRQTDLNFFEKIMFSDEKIFDGDGQLNPKNDVLYAESREHANNTGGFFEKEKFPLKVMVWCGMTFNGVTRVVVLPEKTSFDSNFYVNKVLPVIKEDGIQLIGDDFLFQHDGATSHTSKFTKNSFQEAGITMLRNNGWPPNSPDLSPMDYFFWNEVASNMHKRKFTSRADLVKYIKKTISEIPVEMIQESFKNFKPRCLAVEKANGGIIKNKFQ